MLRHRIHRHHPAKSYRDGLQRPCTNGKPVQKCSNSSNCQSDEFGDAHAACQRYGKRESQCREDKSARQLEARWVRALSSQNRQGGT